MNTLWKKKYSLRPSDDTFNVKWTARNQIICHFLLSVTLSAIYYHISLSSHWIDIATTLKKNKEQRLCSEYSRD